MKTKENEELEITKNEVTFFAHLVNYSGVSYRFYIETEGEVNHAEIGKFLAEQLENYLNK